MFYTEKNNPLQLLISIKRKIEKLLTNVWIYQPLYIEVVIFFN